MGVLPPDESEWEAAARKKNCARFCRPECPVAAIYPDDEVPRDQQQWIAINAEMAPKLPVITEKKPPLRQE